MRASFALEFRNFNWKNERRSAEALEARVEWPPQTLGQAPDIALESARSPTRKQLPMLLLRLLLLLLLLAECPLAGGEYLCSAKNLAKTARRRDYWLRGSALLTRALCAGELSRSPLVDVSYTHTARTRSPDLYLRCKVDATFDICIDK